LLERSLGKDNYRILIDERKMELSNVMAISIDELTKATYEAMIFVLRLR